MATAFFATALLSTCAAISLLLMPWRGLRRADPANPTAGTMGRAFADGLRWLWAHRLLRDLGLIIAVSNIAYGATTAIFVLFAREVLGVDAMGLGIIGACIASGGVLGSVMAGPLVHRMRERGTFLLVLFATALAFASVGLTSDVVVTTSMLALVATMFTVWEAVWRVMRIRLVPAHLLGRVTGLLRWLEMGPFPLASLLGRLLVAVGAMLEDRRLGLHLPYLLTAVVFVVLGLILYPLLSPALIAAAEMEVHNEAW